MSSLTKHLQEPHERLLAIVARLNPILNPQGFLFRIEHNGVSSGGPFANGFYERHPIKIGLIVRREILGMPTYDFDEHICAHDELIKTFGRGNESKLRGMKYPGVETTDGSDVVDALVADIQNIILPVILRHPDAYAVAVTSLHQKFLESMGFKESQES
jgi:hypothetical protein